MLFKQAARGTEKGFIVVKNTSGVTIAANAPLYFETDAVTDGFAVSQAQGGLQGLLFAGIADVAMLNNDINLAQCYGYRTSAYASAASAGCAIGTPLIPVAGQNYLTDSTSAGANNWNQVTLFETIGAAAGNSGVLQWNVFLRI
jgi:hypothetical protein